MSITTVLFRNQYRRLLRRGRSREDAIAEIQKSYGVDTSWFINALDPEVVKADSIADMKTGIVLDDLARINALEIDFELEPPLFEITPTHHAATWLLHPNAPKVEMPELIKNRIERMKKERE